MKSLLLLFSNLLLLSACLRPTRSDENGYKHRHTNRNSKTISSPSSSKFIINPLKSNLNDHDTIDTNINPNSNPINTNINTTRKNINPVIYIESKVNIRKASKRALLREILSGCAVSLSTLPASAAYGTIIGISPLLGIWSSVIVGLLVAIFGVGPGIIAGAAGVITVPIAKLVTENGLPYMSVTILLASLLEMTFSFCKLSKLANYVTEPVIVGFMNAFALYLLNAQTKFFTVKETGLWLPQAQLIPSISLALLCMALIRLAPLITTLLPPSLIAIILTSLLSIVAGLNVQNLADVAGKEVFSGGLNSFPKLIDFSQLPPLNLDTLKIIFPTAVAIMIISIIETLLVERLSCESLRSRYAKSRDNKLNKAKNSSSNNINSNSVGSDVDDFTDTATVTDGYDYNDDDVNMKYTLPADRKSSNSAADREVLALSVGNAASSLFGGFGGCGLIPNTILNSRNGGRTYISSISYALSLALSVICFAPVIGRVPIAALTGLMLNLGLTTFDVKHTWQIIKDALIALKQLLFAKISNGVSSSSVKNKADSVVGSVKDSVSSSASNTSENVSKILDATGLIATGVLCFQVDMGLGVLVGVLITQSLNIVNGIQEKFSSLFPTSTTTKTKQL